MSSRNPPWSGGPLNFGFRNRTEGAKWNEFSPTPNRFPPPHVPNVLIMDEPIEEQVELEENLEEHEVDLQEDLDDSRFEDSSFF